MADPIDLAADLQELANAAAVARHGLRSAVAARVDCADCGDVIPDARRVLRVSRCLPYQVLHERGVRR